jgi:hypothetical protein
LKRQRISLTMRLDGASTGFSRVGDTNVGVNANAESGARERRPFGPTRAKPEPAGAIALALERAKLKK